MKDLVFIKSSEKLQLKINNPGKQKESFTLNKLTCTIKNSVLKAFSEVEERKEGDKCKKSPNLTLTQK